MLDARSVSSPDLNHPQSMDAFRHRKSPLSDRFLASFSEQQALTATADPGELDEGELFWIGTDFSSSSILFPSIAKADAVNHGLSPSRNGHLRPLAPEKNFGILAALPEDENKWTFKSQAFLQRNSSMSSSTTSSSPTSSRMMIPVIPKPKQEHGFSAPNGRIHLQSVPMNVPVMPVRARKQEDRLREMEGGVDEDEDEEEEEMLPPHEIVARASAKESPMTTFSVLEGVGRTLKGRDLRRVRNAVWRQTGFLD